MLSSKTLRRFQALYPKAEEPRTSFCPYRICPIGAHSDHQYGLICGFAIEEGISLAYAPTEDGTVELSSMAFPGQARFSVQAVPPKAGDWADYLRGAAQALGARRALTRGVVAVIQGTLPIGGLSSSAAVIIAFLRALCAVNGIRLSQRELIDTALAAERGYVGVNVGKLDQSCEVYARRDCLLYLDTRDDSYELIPRNPAMRPFEIAIFFSGAERTLVGSAFNMRVDELKAAAYALKGFADLAYGSFAETRLRDVPRDVFERHKDRLPDNWRKRATHFYTEFERVERGVQDWRAGDLESFGRRIFESGHSSIYNYETGSPELKALYELMRETEGIYGGRFSGAGFKGCCMALIDPAFRESIARRMQSQYLKRFPALEGKYSVHFTRIADGCGAEDRP